MTPCPPGSFRAARGNSRAAVALLLVVGFGYAAGSHVAYLWFNADGLGAVFFPAAGVTVAALLLVPLRRWPLVLLAAGAAELIMDTIHGIGIGASLGYMLANTVEPAIGAGLVLRLHGRVDLRRLRDLAVFLICAVVVAPLAGGAIGATAFTIAEGGSWLRFAGEWWIGDALGVLVVGGTVLALAAPRRIARSRLRSLETAALVAAAIGATAALFLLERAYMGYAIVVLLLLLAIRHGTGAVALAGAGLAFVAAEATAEGHSFWLSLGVAEATAIVYLQLLVGLLVAAALVVAAAIHSRDEAVLQAARAARTSMLLEAAAELANTRSVDDAVCIFVGHARRRLGAARAAIALEEDGELVLHFSDDTVDDAWRRPPQSLVRDALTAGERVEVGSPDELELRYPLIGRLASADGLQAFAAVPLARVAGGPAAAAGVAFDCPRRLSDDEWELLEALAERAREAITRVLLLDSEQRAREGAELSESRKRRATERTAALRETTEALSVATSVEAVVHAVFDRGLAVLGAGGGQVGIPDELGYALFRAGVGTGALIAEYDAADASRPGARVAGAGRAQWFATRAELLAKWPGIEHQLEPEHGAAAILPLELGAGPGFLVVHFSHEGELPAEDRELVVTLAHLCAQALDRVRLLESESRARTRAEFLTDIISELESVAGFPDRAQRLTDLLVPRIADVALIETPDAERALGIATDLGSKGSSALLPQVAPDWEILRLAAGGAEQLVSRGRPPVSGSAPSTTAPSSGLDTHSLIAVPLGLGSDPGVLLVGLVDERRRPYAPRDLAFVREIAQRTGPVLANARLQDAEHAIALKLQRALLPERLVSHRRLEIAATYRAAHELLEVGGDWYDTLLLPDGRIGVCVGDVVGHGVDSATAMGRLRSAVAAMAPDAGTPGRLLTKLGELAAGPDGVDFATACYAIVDPRDGAIEYASAGHPPMLVVTSQGETAWLDEGRSMPLFGHHDGLRAEARASLEPGSLLLLFTDGLVERRGERLSVGLERLRNAAASLAGLAPQRVCERLLDVVPGEAAHDDVVLLCARFAPDGAPTFRRVFPAEADQLVVLRNAVREWLASSDVPPSAQQAVLLALGEACANAVEHAYESGTSGPIEVDVGTDERDLVLRVRDHGSWRTPVPSDERGRGTAIMRSLCDDFARETGPDGTTVTMRLSLCTPDSQ